MDLPAKALLEKAVELLAVLQGVRTIPNTCRLDGTQRAIKKQQVLQLCAGNVLQRYKKGNGWTCTHMAPTFSLKPMKFMVIPSFTCTPS